MKHYHVSLNHMTPNQQRDFQLIQQSTNQRYTVFSLSFYDISVTENVKYKAGESKQIVSSGLVIVLSISL